MDRAKKFLAFILTLAFIALPFAAFWQRQAIYDWLKLRNYSPPAAVASLATATAMNSQARHIFYVNHPELIGDSDTFRNDCTSTEQTIILGCYHPPQLGIFVYDVHDERLNGIEEVTAAHEMLHAAYDRLKGSERDKINKLLNDFYKNELKDQRILETIDSYKKTEPQDLINEMHSIFGTEIATLPAPLEDYYKRYFSNRQAVVAFSQKYETEFTSRAAKASQIEKQLNSLKAKISAEEANLRAQLAKINSDQARLESLRNSGRIEEYNAGVGPYNAEVDTYNAGVAQYKRDVDTYNALLDQYNAIAGELKQLYGAIDTRLAPKAQ